MTKYSTPSIEVVTFNSSDAPRIGMQWWADNDGNGGFMALGQNWTFSTPDHPVRPVSPTGYAFFNYELVTPYNCYGENIPGAMSYPTDYNGYTTLSIVVDDGKSC